MTSDSMTRALVNAYQAARELEDAFRYNPSVKVPLVQHRHGAAELAARDTHRQIHSLALKLSSITDWGDDVLSLINELNI